MAARGGVVRRTGEALLVLTGLGVLSAASQLDAQPLPLRILLGLVGVAVLAPVRHRLSPEAWLTDGPRSFGRHVLSACLFLAWIMLLIAVGAALGDVATAVMLGPGMAIGFVGSWSLADVITGSFTSAQFTVVEPTGDGPVEWADPPA